MFICFKYALSVSHHLLALKDSLRDIKYNCLQSLSENAPSSSSFSLFSFCCFSILMLLSFCFQFLFVNCLLMFSEIEVSLRGFFICFCLTTRKIEFRTNFLPNMRKCTFVLWMLVRIGLWFQILSDDFLPSFSTKLSDVLLQVQG